MKIKDITLQEVYNSLINSKITYGSEFSFTMKKYKKDKERMSVFFEDERENKSWICDITQGENGFLYFDCGIDGYEIIYLNFADCISMSKALQAANKNLNSRDIDITQTEIALYLMNSIKGCIVEKASKFMYQIDCINKLNKNSLHEIKEWTDDYGRKY